MTARDRMRKAALLQALSDCAIMAQQEGHWTIATDILALRTKLYQRFQRPKTNPPTDIASMRGKS